MGSYTLIKAFENETVLPIDLNRVVRWLKIHVEVDVIEFIGVELEVGTVRGYLIKYRDSEGGWDIDAPVVARIFYDAEQGAEWVQLVCGKELLHILDRDQVRSQAQLDKLTTRLALPGEVRHLLEDPAYAAADRAGVIMACALLLPMAARAALLDPYKAGHITDAEIARQAVIPEHYVRLVMSDEWTMLYELIQHVEQIQNIAKDKRVFGKSSLGN